MKKPKHHNSLRTTAICCLVKDNDLLLLFALHYTLYYTLCGGKNKFTLLAKDKPQLS